MSGTRLIRRLSAAVTVGALTLAVGACGGGATTELDAAGVIQALIKQGMPATLTVTYDESSDPNKLLGRPNGYTSKASFADRRVDSSKVPAAKPGDVELGGSVEVFASADEAEARAAYIQEIGKKLPMLGEYNYVKGPVVVRVSKELTPTDAQPYEGALGKVVE